MTPGSLLTFRQQGRDGEVAVTGIVNGERLELEDGRVYVPVHVQASNENLLVDTRNIIDGKESTMTEQTTNLAAALASHAGAAYVEPDKAPYGRIRVGPKTLAYAMPRKNGVVLEFAAADVAKAPKRFQTALEPRGDRVQLRVNGKNVARAEALLEWLVKQTA